MTRKLLFTFFALFTFALGQAQQVVSIVGTGVNGWPDEMIGPEIDLMTSDFITYTLSNVTVTAGQVKFRYNHSWDTNWGGTGFPTGVATQNGANIPTTAGTYTITFNRNTGAYSFVGSSAFPSIGIWGPAVDSQNGFGGPDVDMTTTDGMVYKLSAFWFSSGSGLFRQDDNSLMTYGSTAFPTGTAVSNGPNILVTGGQYSVTFNRSSGAYNFYYPSVGLLGTFNNWGNPDVDFSTSNGETYTLENFVMPTDGFVKLRLDDEWTVNWGGNAFPDGTLVLNGNDMPVTAGTYNVSFNRNTLGIVFTPSLGVGESAREKITIYPNPTKNVWNIASGSLIEKVQIFDLLGKLVADEKSTTIDASRYESGIYVAKITSNGSVQTFKLVKK